MSFEKFTGAFSFPDPKAPKERQFGMTGATAHPSGDGVLTVVFRLVDTGIVVAQDESSIRLDIPEALARQAIPIISMALERLDALRKDQKP